MGVKPHPGLIDNVAGLGTAWYGVAGLGVAWSGKAGIGKARVLYGRCLCALIVFA